MEQVYEWIRNITYYLIFITVLLNLLPGRKYEKYMKLFAGMVLILLVLKPLTGGLRLDEKLAYYFESFTFKQEAEEFTGEMWDMEEIRLQNVIAQYEEAIENDLRTMAEAEGFFCSGVQAVIDGEEENETFGRVTSVSMTLSLEENDEKTGAPELVEPIRIDPVKARTDGKGEDSLTEDRIRKQEENSRLAGLRRRIAEYYDLEETDIEIQLEKGNG